MILKTTSRHAIRKLQRARVQELLIFIGMPHKMVYARKNAWSIGKPSKPFWERYQNQLPAVLHDAHDFWKDRIKKVYPRRHGESSHEAALLNAVWTRVKKLFKQRGATLE